MFRNFALLPLFLFCVASFSIRAQLELPQDKVSWKFSVEQKGGEATVIAKIKVVNHWHINATKLPAGTFGLPTEFTLKKSTHFEQVGGIIEPKPILKYDDIADEQLAYHEGSLTLKRKIKVLSKEDFELTGTFVFQTCNDVKCLPDHTVPFKLKIKGFVDAEEKTDGANGDSLSSGKNQAEKNNDNSNAADNRDEKKAAAKKENTQDKDRSLLTIFLLSFVSGLLALFTPCVLPMVPLTVSFFTHRSKTRGEGIRKALLYSVSIILIYIILGTAVTAIFGEQALNDMSTNPWFNLFFFLLLVVFAVSFLGAFEIRMPSWLINKAEGQTKKGGILGIFFMALVLALVSFSCTGPIVGTLIVEAARHGGITPIVGMFGFSLALALPFGLFAAFPGWMNSMPKSGGWMNSVKVVLGLLELALAFKFLSNADMTWDLHLLERELFIGIWVVIFIVMTLYLFGMILLPHDSPVERLSVGRTMLGSFTLLIVIYLLPGLWGAPLKLISAFPPPLQYSEWSGPRATETSASEMPPGAHVGPQNLPAFHDYDEALAYAKKVNKPLFVDFTGINCVNCRKMEQQVWGEPGIIETLKNDVVIVSLHVDERKELPAKEQGEFESSPGKKMSVVTTGDKWKLLQVKRYNILAQPYYVMQDTDGKDLGNGAADYEHHSNPNDFKNWLNKGMSKFKNR
jgi:thiol:disulfide interchange protein DsbD